MGFGFSAGEPQSRPTIVTIVRDTALEAFRRHGLEVSPVGEAVLADTTGGRYSLVNLIHSCQYSERSEWPALIDQHARSMAEAARAADPTTVPEAEFHALLRERVLAPNFALPMAEYSYCRPLVDDEPDSPLVALSLDYPDHVATLSDSKLAGRDLAAAWSAGRRNTALEKVDVHREMGKDGIVIDIVGGNSLFIASKVADMQTLIIDHLGPAPYGVVFAIPNRHEIVYYRPMQFEETVLAVPMLLDLVQPRYANAPGPISPAVYFWRDGVTSQVSDARKIRAGGAFEAMITELMAASPQH